MKFPDEVYRDICSIKTLYSPSEGFFNDFVNVVLQKIDQNWIENVFKSGSSDKDKIRICCNDAVVWPAIREVLKNVSKVYRKKSSEGAKESLTEGDLLFKLTDFKKAVMIYSQSLIRAPQCETNEVSFDRDTLPMAYKGRANALFHLGRYRECLKDLNMAIKEKVPDHIKYQIFKQMGECYRNIGEVDRGQISLQISLQLLDEQILKMDTAVLRTKREKSESSALKKMLIKEREDLRDMIQQIDKKVEGPQESRTPYQGPLPALSGKPNDQYPNASNLIKIRQSNEAGRFAAAADKIDIGATLVIEDPHASVLISPMLSSHCLHCFTRLLAPVPCKTCAGVAFCSQECRDSATSSYHKYECELLGLFLGSGMSVLSLLALRMVTQESLDFFKQLQCKLESSSPSTAFSSREADYIRVYNLTTHSQLRTGLDYFRRTLMALFLVECLKKTKFFGIKPESESFSEDEILTGSIILHHLQLLQFNAHEIYETRVLRPNQTRDAKAVYLGVAVYPTVALFNHECASSVTRYFNGKKIVIKSVRPLDKNDVLSENYGPNYAKKSVIERSRELTSRYWFNCKCKACSEDWPKIEDLTAENLIIRCNTLQCPGTFSRTKLKRKSEPEQTCLVCLQKTNVLQALESKNQLENLFEKSLDLMEELKYEEAVSFLISYLKKILRLIAPPSREIFLTQEALRTCYAQTGNVWVLDE